MSEPASDAPSLGESAHRRIRADIVACRLAPGQRLTERALADELGMGVSPVRDALTRLDREGLVRTIPRKGYQVKPLTIRSVDELFSFWGILGPELARRGVAEASSAQLKAARKLVTAIQGISEDDDSLRESALRAVQLCDRFFELLAEATGNEYIVTTYDRVTSELARVWTLVIDSELLDAGRMLGPFAEAGDALAHRDTDAIAELSAQYISHSHDRVLRTLARWPSVITSEVVPVTAAQRHKR
jgi:DNA-binding GntR family transcriptional regulator